MRGKAATIVRRWIRLFTGLGFGLVMARTAFAHGFGQRYALPVPLWLYVTGAAIAVAFSFVVVGVFVGRTPKPHASPRLNLLRFPVGRLLAHPVWLRLVKLIAVGFFLLLILTGLVGNQHPMRNLSPTLVWIIWWVGMAYISALAGNLWALMNPLSTLFAWAEGLYHHICPTRELTLSLPYPHLLGQWPGVLLFLAFAWIELVFKGSAVPSNLAIMALVYAGITWSGMFLFGREPWLRHGEAFSLAFGILAHFAPTEVRVIDPEVCRTCSLDCRDQDGECIDCYACFRRAAPAQRQWNLRPFAAGLLRKQAVSTSEMAFVLLLLATVTFDGFEATPLWVQIETTLAGLFPQLAGARLLGIKTLGLVIFPALFLGLYLVFSWIMAITIDKRLPGGTLARAFIFTLVPIAIAYHMAHYFTFLLIQGQFIIPLLSDPFGFGWDLLGTVGYRPNIGMVGARFAWVVAVMAIVIGHIIAVYLAHLVAIRTLRERLLALYSQYPMLVLMVGYTMISLWILAQPIVEQRVSPPVTAAASPAGEVEVPPEAFLPVAGSGVLRPVGAGHTAEAKITYRMLLSAFHDGTHMTVADLLYPYIFAYRWGVRRTADEPTYDPYVAKTTALLRQRLVGFRVVRVDRSERGFGQLKLVRVMPVVEVYVNHIAADPAQVAALAPPWSSLPWSLLVVMEEAVRRGWAAFSAAAAQRQGVKWLDLVRDRALQERLAALVQSFAQQGYVPAGLQRFVTVDEARRRWTALQKFYRTHGHFLVTNGPYIIAKWSKEATVLKVFRDMSYPLGVGSYDRYAIPHRAYISAIKVQGQVVEIYADVERVEKFQRTYRIVRQPLHGGVANTNKRDIPVCRYVVVGADGLVTRTGTATYRSEDGVFRLDLRGRLAPGRYTISVALYLNENAMNPDIQSIQYRVADEKKT